MLDNTHTVKIAVHSAEGCCTATTMVLTSIKQKSSASASSLHVGTPLVAA